MRKVFLSLIVVFGLCLSHPVSAQDRESTFNRVLRMGVMRCSYFVVPPEFIKDPNSGKLSGIGYDLTEAVGRVLGIKIEWTEEIGFGEMAAGLKTNRYDAVCSSVFNRAVLTREGDFTTPFMYTPVGIFVRADDSRFDKSTAALNDASITVAAIDGEPSNEIAGLDFPKTKRFTMPQNTFEAMLMESVATKKADVCFTYMANFYNYNKSNPGKLKSIHADKPIRAFGNTIMIPRGEYELKSMLNAAINELLNSGEVDAIITKYEPYPGAYYHVDTAYKVP